MGRSVEEKEREEDTEKWGRNEKRQQLETITPPGRRERGQIEADRQRDKAEKDTATGKEAQCTAETTC